MYLMFSAFLILSELPPNSLDIINKSMEHIIVPSPKSACCRRKDTNETWLALWLQLYHLCDLWANCWALFKIYF